LLAHVGSATVEQVGGASVVVREQLLAVLPLGGDDLAHGVALGRVANGGGETVRERQPSERLDGRLPPARRPGDGHRVGATGRHRDVGGVVAVGGDRLADRVDRRRRGRPAAGAKRADVAVRGAVGGEDVATQPRARRFDDVQRRRGRHGGVESVPALSEGFDARLGGEGLAGRDHPPGAVHSRAPGGEPIEIRTWHTPRSARRLKKEPLLRGQRRSRTRLPDRADGHE
jgi:hypothetical protein